MRHLPVSSNYCYSWWRTPDWYERRYRRTL